MYLLRLSLRLLHPGAMMMESSIGKASSSHCMTSLRDNCDTTIINFKSMHFRLYRKPPSELII